MATIVTRSGKGSPLTNTEVDANFTNLNTDKLESGDLSVTTTAVGTAALNYSSGVFTYTPPDLSAIDLSLYAPLAGAVFTGTVEAPLFEGDLSGAQLFPAKAGEALTKGDALYISGISGNKPVVMKADANDPAKMPSFGLAGATVNNNASVNCVTYGQIHNVDTTAFSLGDQLYVSTTAGALTSTAPTGETSQIQNLGKVERVHQSAGALFVAGSGRANATPNLDNGNFFLGNASNQSVSTDFSDSVVAALSGGSGISLSAAGVIDNTAPDQTVALTGSGATSISGTYPNFTITSTNTTYSVGDGGLTQINFTSADNTKLDGIEASADVTDAANVTAAGAVMDSELTSEASVKALNQGVSTTDSPTFTNLTLSGTDSVKVPNGTTAQRNASPANGMFRYNSTTAEFEGYQDGAWGSIGGGSADITLNQFTGDGSDTTFTLSGLAAENNTFVYIDGVYQSKSNYSVSSADPAVLTFSTAPPNTTAIEVMVTAIAVTDIGTPSDNTVTPAKIASGNFYFAQSLGIGTNSPARDLHIHNTTQPYFHMTSGDTGATASDGFSILVADNTNDVILNQRENASIRAFVNGSERFRIESSGNVGIGTSSPASLVSGGSSPVLSIGGTDSGLTTGEKAGSLSFITNDGSYTGTYADGITGEIVSVAETSVGGAYGLAFYTGTTSGSNRAERMRIDYGGNLLVGKSSLNYTSEGLAFRERGEAYITSDGRAPLLVNRLTSTGNIVDFRKDGTSVGSIGSYIAYMYIGSTGGVDTHIGFVNGSVRPATATGTVLDNVLDLGNSSSRWDDIYATNGTINTSDFNEKQDIAELSDAEQRVAVACKGLLRKFRWKDSVAEKGDEARIHFGIIAQDLQAAFAAEGLDAGDYAMFISTTWTDEETNEEKTRMGVRYSELLAFIISAL